MTIVVAASAPDGVVIASDSRATRTADHTQRVISDNADKVFVVYDRFIVGASGLGYIDRSTVRGLMDEYVLSHGQEPDTLHSFCAELGDWFAGRLSAYIAREDLIVARNAAPISFLVAGYSERQGRVLDVWIQGDGTHEVRETDATTSAPSMVYRGQTSVMRRLLLGVDIDGATEGKILADLNTTADQLQESLKPLLYIPNPPLAIQDAIDLCVYAIRTTVLTQRFTDGTIAKPHAFPSCGGPVQIATVDRTGAQWLARPSFQIPETPSGEGR
jgi:hypothetical protein